MTRTSPAASTCHWFGIGAASVGHLIILPARSKGGLLSLDPEHGFHRELESWDGPSLRNLGKRISQYTERQKFAFAVVRSVPASTSHGARPMAFAIETTFQIFCSSQTARVAGSGVSRWLVGAGDVPTTPRIGPLQNVPAPLLRRACETAAYAHAKLTKGER